MLLNTDNGILVPQASNMPFSPFFIFVYIFIFKFVVPVQVGNTSPRLPPTHLNRTCRVFQVIGFRRVDEFFQYLGCFIKIL